MSEGRHTENAYNAVRSCCETAKFRVQEKRSQGSPKRKTSIALCRRTVLTPKLPQSLRQQELKGLQLGETWAWV